MNLKYLILKILLLLQTHSLAVKIGVSKLSTTSTTTLAPNTTLKEIDITVTLPTLITSALDIETSTLAAVTNDTSTTIPEFPPKISKPTKRTTTTKPVTTTTSISTINATTLNPKPTTVAVNSTELEATNHISAYSSNLYCSCDLLPSTCDINCCCDRDCAKEALKVFDCYSPSKYPELRLHLEDFQYEHGLPSCKINDGWLCVFRTNKRPPTKKAYDFNFDTTKNFKWPNTLMELADSATGNERDFYKFGDQLKVFNMDALDVQAFEIPYAYKPPACQLNDPIRHLTPTSTSCLVTSMIEAQETKRKLFNLAATTKLLTKPRNHLTDSDDLKDITKDFKLKSCVLNFKTQDYVCKELDTTYNDTETHESEYYYVIETRIKIVHNFTDLIGCQIEFIEQELLPNEEPFELWQKYSVMFIAANESEMEHVLDQDNVNLHLSLSGPLGYLQGEPIIIAKFIANNESEDLSVHNRVLNYFKNSSMVNNTLNLLSRHNGLCRRSYDKDDRINYGISSLSQCSLRIDKESFTKQISQTRKNSNLTAICVQLQQQILEALFNVHTNYQLNDLTELYVSTLGRPNNSSDKWLPLRVQNLDFAPIVGQLVAESQTLICRNILLSVAYEFHIGPFFEHGIARQSLVKNAVLKLGQRHDLEFTLYERLEVPLSLTVMFFDLSLNTGSLIGGGGGIIYLVLTIFNLKLFNIIA